MFLEPTTDSVHDAAKEMNINIPSEFICPITMEVMKQPLMTRDGFNFERKAILDWLSKGTGYCPLTRGPLGLSDLVPNKVLEDKIAMWMWEYCLPRPKDENEDNDIVVLGYVPNDYQGMPTRRGRTIRPPKVFAAAMRLRAR
jgi:hypothetical protein